MMVRGSCPQSRSSTLYTVEFSAVLLSLFALFSSSPFFFISGALASTPAPYSCSGQTITSALVIDGRNGAVTITGCTYNGAVTINNPTAQVSISATVFMAGLTINGDEGNNGRATLTGPSAITLHDVTSPTQPISITSLVLSPSPSQILPSVLITSSNLHSLTVHTCEFQSGATFSIRSSSILIAGLRLTTVSFDGGRMELYDSKLGSTQGEKSSARRGLWVQDSVWDNGAQFAFENTEVTSKYEAAVFYVDTNATKRGKDTLLYFNMFRNSAVMNLTNSSFVGSAAIVPHFAYINTKFGGRFRYSRFGGVGTKFVAANSRLVGRCSFYFVEGATAELDAVSYQSADLTIHGDNEEQVVIPIPHTISVKRLAVKGARVFLPDLNVPSPTINTWNVEVSDELTVNLVALTEQQRWLVRPRPDVVAPTAGTTIQISKANLTRGSVLDIQIPTLSTCIIAGSFVDSFTTLTNFNATGAVQLGHDDHVLTLSNATLYAANGSANSVSIVGSSMLDVTQVTLDRLTVTTVSINKCTVQGRSTLKMQDVSVTSDGLVMFDTTVHDGQIQFVRTTIASIRGGRSNTRYAFRIGDSLFNSSAQLVFEDSQITAVYEGIFFYPEKYPQKKGQNQFWYMTLFQNGALMNFTNSSVRSGVSAAIQSTHTYVNHIYGSRYRYSRFGSGSKLVATNSQFVGNCHLLLIDKGTTVQLDGDSYTAIDLRVDGDNEDNIAIPIPHTISVKRVALYKAHVFLPDLNVPSPTINTWNVEVSHEFIVNRVRLTNNQRMLVSTRQFPTVDEDDVAGNDLSLTDVDVAANSAIVVADSFFNKVTVSGSVQQSSVVSMHNVTARDFVLFSPLTLLQSSALIVNESSIATLSIKPVLLNDGTSVNCSILVHASAVSNTLTMHDVEVPTDVTLSIVSSTILGVASPALMVRNVFFIGGNLCITQSKVLGRGSGAIQLGTTLNALVSHNEARNVIATNNSRILISESYVGSQPGYGGYSVFSTFHKNKLKVSSYIGTASAEVPPASFILHNSTLKDGPMNVLFRGNGTKVIVDSLTLSRSRIGFNALGDDRYDKDDAGKIDAVGYYFPSSFSCEELTLTGGTIHWGAAKLESFSLVPLHNQVNATTQHVQITVSRSISLVQPLGFELVNGEHLVVRVAEPNKTEDPKAPYLSIFLQPRQVSNGSSILITSSSIANDADDGAASLAEAMSFTMKEVQFSGNSTMSFKNVVFRSNVALLGCLFEDGSMLRMSDSTIHSSVLTEVEFTQYSLMLVDRIGVTTSGVKLTSCKFRDASELHILRSEINTTSAGSSNLHPLWFQLTNFETNDTILNIESTRITAQYRVGTTSIMFVTNAVTIVSASIFIHNVSCLIDPDTPVFGTRYAIGSSTQDHTGPISPRVLAISGPASHPSSFDGSPIAMKVAGTMKMVVGSGVDGIESIRLHGVATALATHNVTLGCAAGSNSTLCDSAKLFGAVRLASESEATETLREADLMRVAFEAGVIAEAFAREKYIVSQQMGSQEQAFSERFDALVAVDAQPCTHWSLGDQFTMDTTKRVTPTPTATLLLSLPPTSTVETSFTPPDAESTVDPTSSDVEAGTLAPPPTTTSWVPPPVTTTINSTQVVPTSTLDTDEPTQSSGTEPPLVTLDNSTQPTPAPTENTTDVPAPNVETMIDKLTKAEEVAIETTVTTTTVFGAVGSVAGGSAAADMQSVLVLGFTTCASDSMRAVSQASKSSLFPLGDTLGTFESARLLGNWVMVGAFAVCHTLVALVFYRKKKASGMSFAAALSKARYPSFSLVIFSLLHQGLVLESCTILLKKGDGKALKDPVSIIVATLTLAVCLTQSVWCVLWCRENFATFRFFRYDHSARHKLLGWCIFATGQWDYQNTKLTMFRSVCGLLNGTRWWMFSSSLQMRSLLIAFVAANEHVPCEVQAVLLCVIFWVHAGLLAVLRPLRLRAVNVFSVMIGVLSGVISLSLLSETMAEMGSSMLWLASVLSVVAAVAQISAILAERSWKKRKTCVFMEGEDPSEHRKNDATAADDGSRSDSSDTSSSSDDDDGADDVEMRALTVPLVKNGDQTDADNSDGERNPLTPSGADELLSTPRFSGSNVDLESNLSFRRANMSFRSVGGGV